MRSGIAAADRLIVESPTEEEIVLIRAFGREAVLARLSQTYCDVAS